MSSPFVPETIDLDNEMFVPVARGRKSEPDAIAEMIADHLVMQADVLSLGEVTQGVNVPVPEMAFLPGDNVAKITDRRIAVRVGKIRKLIEAKRGEKFNVNFRACVSASDGRKFRLVYVRRVK